MPAIHLIDADGQPRRFDAPAGSSLMRAAVDAGIGGIAADCGGCLSCATCHVIVEADWLAHLPAPSADERAMLEMTAEPRQAGSRLACQIVLTAALDGLSARCPARQY